MKRIMLILLVSLLAHTALRAEESYTFSCGTWVEIAAHPYNGYKFVSWSDGNTEQTLRIEVLGDTSLIAYFAPSCERYMSWPIIALYDWLLMINVKELNEKGIYFEEEDVTWYRVRGDSADDFWAEPYERIDDVVDHGYYLTLDKNLKGTGDYYAEVDVSSTYSGIICEDRIRTVVAHFIGTEQTQELMLAPTAIKRGHPTQLMGLIPEEQTSVLIYDASGALIEAQHTTAISTLQLIPNYPTGCYLMHVESATYNRSFKFVITD